MRSSYKYIIINIKTIKNIEHSYTHERQLFEIICDKTVTVILHYGSLHTHNNKLLGYLTPNFLKNWNTSS